MESLARQLQDERERTEGPTQFQDLCLILRHPKTKEAVLWAGGEWDRANHRYTSRDPSNARIVELEMAQVAFVEWFAGWLRDYREGYHRDISLVLNHGGRRGGKTTSAVLCQWAALIDVPARGPKRSIGWIISETFKKRAEIEDDISEFIPSQWFRHVKAPEYKYELENGAILRNLSAQDPEDLRQGRVDILVYNEPQQMQARAVVNGLFGTSDQGGLTILAANPPTMVKGEWTYDLKEAIESGEEKNARHFFFDPKLNRRIDQGARSHVASLARRINPSQMAADDEGEWARISDRAYPKWKKEYIQRVPDVGMRDITAEIIKKHSGIYKPYPYLGGVDFQGYPYNTAVLWKIYEAPGGWIFWAVDEYSVEGHEINLLSEIREEGYDPDQILWVGDASAQWQNFKHEEGLKSFKEFEKDGWRIIPPREKKADSKAQYVGNPRVESRLRVISRIMEQGRIRVDPGGGIFPGAPHMAEAFRETPLKKSATRVFKHTNHAHETDAADYALYRIEPKPKAPRKDTAPRGASFPQFRPGAGFRY